jgi:hypothetical protein
MHFSTVWEFNQTTNEGPTSVNLEWWWFLVGAIPEVHRPTPFVRFCPGTLAALLWLNVATHGLLKLVK